jgi:pseudouridine-5'-monophosphatase
MTKPYSFAVFDMDGVLLDTEPLYTEATQRVVSQWGKQFDWSMKCEMMGKSAMHAADYLVKRLELPIRPSDLLEQTQAILDELFTNCSELPGARALVTALHEHGVPLAVATSSSRRYYELKTRQHSWFELFDAIVCGDDPRVRELKPAPDIFLAAAGDLGADPSRCLVFEDSIAGVQAALAAGMQVIALPDSNNDRSRFSDADWLIGSYAELDLARLLSSFQPASGINASR